MSSQQVRGRRLAHPWNSGNATRIRATGAVESYTGVDFDLLKNSWTIGSTVHNDGTIHGGVKLEM